jgi:LCP family protein required for cell wall assembly
VEEKFMEKDEKKEKKKKKKKYRLWLFILTLITILANFFAIYEILLLGPVEEVIRYVIIGVFLLIDLVFFLKMKKKRKKKENKAKLLTFFLILYLLLSLFIGVVIMYLYGKLENVNKTYVTYSSSLITMSNNSMNKIDDVKDAKIGLLNDKTSPDGYLIPRIIIKENKLDDDNKIKKYDDYNAMIADLYDGTIDAMFITTNYPSLFQSIETYQNIATDTKIIYTKEKKMLKSSTSKRETASTGKSISEPFTILLMGVDSTDEGLSKNTVANGDSLILITFNPKTLNATMLSIPRDSYVPISCWSGTPENKITHAAAYGTDCMMSTIENYFDVKIDYYAKINFRGLVSLVNTLGGIDVEVPQDLCTDDSNREGHVCIKEGMQHLNGEQALVLARNRKQLANGDLDRGLNQQIVIQGIINKVKDMSSVSQVMGVLDTISNNLDTNFTTKQILSFYDIAKDITTNALQKDDADLINIEQLFLSGTGQMIYDERSRLVLWDYIPNKESRKDIINAMKVNLGKKNPTMIREFSFSINTPYEKTVTGTGPYKTASTYTLLPNFIGDSQSAAQAWASRNGVKVTFKGTSGHVIAQSYPANKRADLVSGSVVLTLSGGSSSTTSNSSTTTDNKNTTKDKNNNTNAKDDSIDNNPGSVDTEVEPSLPKPDTPGKDNGDIETPPEKDKVPSE